MPKVLLVLVTSLLAVIAVALVVFHLAQGKAEPFAGTTVGHYLPAPNVPYGDWLTYERERRKASTVTLITESDQFDVTFAELGIEIDVSAMLNQAERQRRTGSLFQRLERWFMAKLSRQNLVLLTRFDSARARENLETLAAFVDRSSVDAEVDWVKRRRVDAKPGKRLDIDATLGRLESHRDLEMATFDLVVHDVRPNVTADQLMPVDLTKVLASFETDFRTRAGARAVNIRVAAKALDGYVILPGATVSFNRVVGPRTVSRGFREAPVIVDDELEPGVGGGVCQVATTLHAAVVLGGLEILERRSHSRPSGYAPMGLDATVIDGEVDLKFRNPYRTALLIATSFPEKYRLRVEILGQLPKEHYEHVYAVRQRYDFYRRIVTKEAVTPGAFERKQKGIYGFDVVSTIVAKDAGKSETRRQYRSKYWPVPEVFWVGPNTDLSLLPPLPEGATGVQRDGVTVMGQIPKEVEERASSAASTESLDQG